MNDSGAKSTYGGAVAALRRALRQGFGRFRRETPGLRDAAVSLCRAASADPRALLAMAIHETPECHVYSHAANTAVYAAAVGRALAVQPPALEELVFQALILDARLGARSDFPWAPGSDARIIEKALHPGGDEGLFTFSEEVEKGLPEGLRVMVVQEGGGEPPPERRQASQGALLLALCDLFETQTHARAWRRADSPANVLFALMRRLRRQSDAGVVRSFFDAITLYPPGTFVQLSNGEFGEIESTRPENPSRPVVRVVCGPRGEVLDPAIRVDIAAGGAIYIERGLAPHEMPFRGSWFRAAEALKILWRDPPSGAY